MTAPLGSVLVTTPSFGQSSRQPWDALTEEGLAVQHPGVPLAPEELAREVADADALIVGLEKIDASVLDAAPRLKVIAKHGVGVDNIDCAAAERRGIRVVNAPGGNTGAVADLAIGLILAASRQIITAHADVVAGGFDRLFGPELGGRTVGIIGFGRIGRAVARRLRGFDVRILAYDPYVADEVLTKAEVRPVGFADCVTTSDILTLHRPFEPGSAPALDQSWLRQMRRGACVINTARGGLVDEEALADLLRQGHLAAAAVDVFSTEPPLGNPLLTAPNVVLTPHIGACTEQANATVGVTIVRDIARVLRGESPHNSVG